MIDELTVDQMQTRETIKRWIKDICAKKNYTATNLARESKISPSTVLRLFNDEEYRFTPTMVTLQKVSSATGYPLPKELLNASNAPFALPERAQPGPKAAPEDARNLSPARMKLALAGKLGPALQKAAHAQTLRGKAGDSAPVEDAETARSQIADNIQRLTHGIKELVTADGHAVAEIGTRTDKAQEALDSVSQALHLDEVGAGKSRSTVARVLQSRSSQKEAPSPAPAMDETVGTERLIPLYTVSAFPSSITARRHEAGKLQCPEQLIDYPDAFAVKVGDNSMAPVLRSGSVGYGSKYRDPVVGDLVYLRRQDGRSFVRSCADINENGVLLQDAKGAETLVSFEEIEEIGALGFIELVGFD